MEEKFDMVILDTPPLEPFIDGAVITSQTDGTILVIEENAIEYKRLQHVVEQLQKANAKILGSVLSKVKTNEFRYHYEKYKNYSRRQIESKV